MDFPPRFYLEIAKDWICSKAWRGLALKTVQTQRGTTVLSYSEVVEAATGDRFGDNDVALHVVTKPMLCVTGTSLNNSTLLAAKPGVAYYVHSVTLVAVNLPDATNYTAAALVACGPAIFAAATVVPTATVGSALSATGIIDAAGSINTALSVSRVVSGGTFASYERVIVSYAEVSQAP